VAACFALGQVLIQFMAGSWRPAGPNTPFLTGHVQGA
jgi:hypothetical protein